MADAAVSKTAIFGCASSTLASGTISNATTPLVRGVVRVWAPMPHPVGCGTHRGRPVRLGSAAPQPIRPGAVRRSLRQMAEIAQNAVVFAARWLKSHGMRCAPAAPSRTGLARLINDLGFCNRRSRQETRFARFENYISAHLCQRPSKSTAHRPISASPRAPPQSAPRPERGAPSCRSHTRAAAPAPSDRPRPSGGPSSPACCGR